MIEVIPYDEFCVGIAPLWNQAPNTIPIWNNPYYIVEYPQEQWSSDIIYFPARYILDGEAVGYISIYNLSDCHIRPRGIYIKPEHRGRGLGHQMQRAAWDLFPQSFYRAFIWSRQENVERFCTHSQMSEVPDVGAVWSEFSKLNMHLLYHDRGHPPSDQDLMFNREFLNRNKKQYSLGGINNINVAWNDREWLDYFDEHAGAYDNLHINLNF